MRIFDIFLRYIAPGLVILGVYFRMMYLHETDTASDRVPIPSVVQKLVYPLECPRPYCSLTFILAGFTCIFTFITSYMIIAILTIKGMNVLYRYLWLGMFCLNAVSMFVGILIDTTLQVVIEVRQGQRQNSIKQIFFVIYYIIGYLTAVLAVAVSGYVCVICARLVFDI